MELFETWALTLIVFLPLAGALLIGIIPKTKETALKGTGLLVAVRRVRRLPRGDRQFDFSGLPYNTYQFEIDVPWIGAINANYHLGVDGISLPLLVLSTFIMVLAVIYSWNHWEEPHNPKAFLILMLILATGLNGTFVALDLVLFFIFFEVVLLPMYFMIGIWGDRLRGRSPATSARCRPVSTPRSSSSSSPSSGRRSCSWDSSPSTSSRANRVSAPSTSRS